MDLGGMSNTEGDGPHGRVRTDYEQENNGTEDTMK